MSKKEEKDEISEDLLTLLKSGGGFFPLQRLERHHTAFLVIERLVFLLNSLCRGKETEREMNRKKIEHVHGETVDAHIIIFMDAEISSFFFYVMEINAL